MNTRMITAELTRFRHNRPLVLWTWLLTNGAIIGLYLTAEGFHLSDPHSYGPAGGTHYLFHAMWVISTIGGVAAVIAGSASGTGDVSVGIFRDLVVTGKPRRSLFAARIPGLLLFFAPFVAAAYLVTIAFTFALAGHLATPSLGEVAKDGAWALGITSAMALTSLGVSSLIGSRAISIGVLLGWQLAVAQILASVSALGATRDVLFPSAAQRLEPFRGDPALVAMSYLAALCVVVAWTTIPLAAGAWRTITREA
jgi:ABC-type transport system involved in multi-copper enzyme maturation permease subunit